MSGLRRTCLVKGRFVAADKKMPVSAVRAGAGPESSRTAPTDGHLPVSELLADRAAAPSPFGDDQTFPLPVERLTYIPVVRQA